VSLFNLLSPDGAPMFVSDLSHNGDKPYHALIQSDAELQKFTRDRDRPGHALYYTVATLGRPWRAKANVKCSNWLYTEIDFKDHPGLSPEEILKRLDASPLPPTLIVASGHGLHLYWQLKRQYAPPQEKINSDSRRP
jgi:hypothetical protein